MTGSKKQRKEKKALRNEGKLFLCMACKEGKQLNSSADLEIHGDIIHKGKVAKCSRCEVLFDIETEDLELHNLEEHPRRNCPDCGKVFDVEALEEHLKYCLGEK